MFFILLKLNWCLGYIISREISLELSSNILSLLQIYVTAEFFYKWKSYAEFYCIAFTSYYAWNFFASNVNFQCPKMIALLARPQQWRGFDADACIPEEIFAGFWRWHEWWWRRGQIIWKPKVHDYRISKNASRLSQEFIWEVFQDLFEGIPMCIWYLCSLKYSQLHTTESDFSIQIS